MKTKMKTKDFRKFWCEKERKIRKLEIELEKAKKENEHLKRQLILYVGH